MFRVRELNDVKLVPLMNQSCSRTNNECHYDVNTLVQNTHSSHDWIDSLCKQWQFHYVHTNCMHVHTCSHVTDNAIYVFTSKKWIAFGSGMSNGNVWLHNNSGRIGFVCNEEYVVCDTEIITYKAYTYSSLDCWYVLECVVYAICQPASNEMQTWLILPVVICLFQRLSHACVCITYTS